MDQVKLELAANWMQAVVEEGRILQSGTNLELSDMGDDRCRLSFEIDGAERTIPMPADWVQHRIPNYNPAFGMRAQNHFAITTLPASQRNGKTISPFNEGRLVLRLIRVGAVG